MKMKAELFADTVAHLDLREAITIPAETKARDALARMLESHLGCTIVVDAAGKAVGTFGERMILSLLAGDPGKLDDPVGDHLAPAWASVRRSDSLATLVDLMRTRDLRYVCVVDDAGVPIALTGEKGLMEYLAEAYPAEIASQNVERRRYATVSREGA